jgi:hypothetical protein
MKVLLTDHFTLAIIHDIIKNDLMDWFLAEQGWLYRVFQKQFPGRLYGCLHDNEKSEIRWSDRYQITVVKSVQNYLRLHDT